jgi:hypothetical protein
MNTSNIIDIIMYVGVDRSITVIRSILIVYRYRDISSITIINIWLLEVRQ